MSYSNPDRRDYVFPAVDFGAGDTVHGILGPNGKKGTLVDIHLSATETFTNTTTAGNVQVGTGADPDAYALFDGVGTLAAEDGISASGLSDPDWLIDKSLPADTQVKVTCTAPTGGTPAGIATVTVTIDWAD